MSADATLGASSAPRMTMTVGIMVVRVHLRLVFDMEMGIPF